MFKLCADPLQNQTKLRNTVHGSDIIEVCRGDGTVDTVRTEDLVPGDVIIIPPNGCTLYCDAILLFGTCIVNESMLTGKSITICVPRDSISTLDLCGARRRERSRNQDTAAAPQRHHVPHEGALEAHALLRHQSRPDAFLRRRESKLRPGT